MKNKPHHITIPEDLREEINQYRERMEKEIGFKPNLSDSIRHLIRKGLKTEVKKKC